MRFLHVGHDLTPFVPLALREAVSGSPQPEHRHVTIAFIHFDGVDALIDRDGPDIAARTLDDLVSAVQVAIDPRHVSFLGTDIAPGGGKVILTAGTPASFGEDEEQMLLALRAFVDSGPALPVRIGVNGGHVFAGEIGTIHRRTYTVMGDAVNLAARVMAKADAGQILATETVLRGSRTLFETRRYDPFLVKGKRQPVTAFSVGSPQAVRAGIASSDLPLVGRDEELKAVLALVDLAHRGVGHLVEVTGDPGAGKTRFVDEVVRRAGTIRAYRVQCRQYQAATPYFAFRDLLRELLGLVGRTNGEALAELARVVASTVPSLNPWLPLIAIPLGLDDEESGDTALLVEAFRKQHLERSVVELLASLVAEPTLICFEDTHWMDEASGDLLRALERELAESPWLLCVTHRLAATGYAPLPGPATTKVELTALGFDSAADLLKVATANAPLPEHLVRALAERSDGNPLFALELLHAFRTHGDLEALPQSVEALIAARIDRLPAADRTVLHQVSVLGAGFWATDVAAVLPDIDDENLTFTLAPLGDLLDVRPSGWVTFRHTLIRDVAYHQLPFSVRGRLHGLVAESILRATGDDGSEQAALLSLHFAHAQRYTEAWRYARIAGDSAREIYANLEAITLYRRALQAARHLPELSDTDRADIFERLGDAQDLAGLYEDSGVSYRAARRLLRDEPVRQARLSLKDAFVAERNGRYREAVRSIRRGQRFLEGVAGDDAAKVRAHLTVWYAVMCLDQGKPREGARWSRAGVSLAESAGDEAALARAYLVLDVAESTLGRPYTLRALEIYTRLGDLSGQATAANNLGVGAYFEGRWNEAIDFYMRAREARKKTGDPVNAALSNVNMAEILTDQGHLDEAREILMSAAEVFMAAGDRWGECFTERCLGIVASRAGRFHDAAALLESGRGGMLAIGANADVISADIAIADNLVLAGDGGEALLILGRVLRDGEPPDAPAHRLPEVHRLRGVAFLQTGEIDRGCRELDVSVSLARRQNASYQMALALEALERVAGNGSEEHQDEYEDIFDQLGVVSHPRYPLPAHDAR